MQNMIKNHAVVLVVFLVVNTYLVMGVIFYMNDVRYSRAIVRLCSLNITTSKGQDCLLQNISLKEDLPTATILTIGWLPILVIRAIGR